MVGRAALGAVVKARRLEYGWTQEQLAERISAEGEYVRQSEISRIENGRIALPRRERLERLAAALDLPLGVLLAQSGWAGAEPHFQPSGDAPAPERQRERHTAPAEVIPAQGRPAAIRSNGVDRGAITEFRQAVARMHEESIRLQSNRRTATEMQRRLRLADDDTAEGTAAPPYSEMAGV